MPGPPGPPEPPHHFFAALECATVGALAGGFAGTVTTLVTCIDIEGVAFGGLAAALTGAALGVGASFAPLHVRMSRVVALSFLGGAAVGPLVAYGALWLACRAP